MKNNNTVNKIKNVKNLRYIVFDDVILFCKILFLDSIILFNFDKSLLKDDVEV